MEGSYVCIGSLLDLFRTCSLRSLVPTSPLSSVVGSGPSTGPSLLSPETQLFIVSLSDTLNLRSASSTGTVGPRRSDGTLGRQGGHRGLSSLSQALCVSDTPFRRPPVPRDLVTKSFHRDLGRRRCSGPANNLTCESPRWGLVDLVSETSSRVVGRKIVREVHYDYM